MKITQVRCHVLDAPIDQPFASSQHWDHGRKSLIVEIHAENGMVGWGEGFGGPPRILAAIVESTFAPLLVGADALATEMLWQRLYDSLRDHGQKGVVIQALSAIDVALWDLKGKIFDVPISVLMGGPIRQRVRAYATGLYRRAMDLDENRTLLLDEARGYVDQGFTAMKVKIGFGYRYDLDMVESLRRLIGSEIELMADMNHGYDLTDAARVARGIEPFDLGWIEEPVVPEDLAGYAELRRRTCIPIAGGESHFGRYGFREIMERGAMQIIQPDLCAAGGLSETKKIVDMAQAFGVRCVPHVWGTGLGIAAALHLIAVMPDVATGWQKNFAPILEYDSTPHPFRQAILKTPLLAKDGYIQVPEGPGLGIEVDRDALERFRAPA